MSSSSLVPPSFKASFVTFPGTPAHISPHAFTTPLPPDQVTIKVTATAINPVDWKLRDSGAFITQWPTIFGSDAAGTIVELGSSISSDPNANLKIGDRVFFQGVIGDLDKSTFSQYARIWGSLVGKLPDTVGDEEGAGISLGAVTAVIGLYHKTGRGLGVGPWDTENGGGQVGRGKAIVVLGGSTSVGQYVIQMAKLSGYERVITNSGKGNIEFLKGLGADVVLDRKTENGVVDFVNAMGEELELDVVYDAVELDGAQKLGVEIIRGVKRSSEGAMVVSVAVPDEDAVKAGEGDDGKGLRKVDVRGILAAGYWPDYRYVTEPFYEAMGRWLAEGTVVPNRVQVVPGGLEAVEKAMIMNKEGVSGVKVVIRPQEGL